MNRRSSVIRCEQIVYDQLVVMFVCCKLLINLDIVIPYALNSSNVSSCRLNKCIIHTVRFLSVSKYLCLSKVLILKTTQVCFMPTNVRVYSTNRCYCQFRKRDLMLKVFNIWNSHKIYSKLNMSI